VDAIDATIKHQRQGFDFANGHSNDFGLFKLTGVGCEEVEEILARKRTESLLLFCNNSYRVISPGDVLLDLPPLPQSWSPKLIQPHDPSSLTIAKFGNAL
jgi:hypothetical protein